MLFSTKIVDRVELFKFYSTLCDETTDICTVEQFTFIYVYIPNCTIREYFIGFIKMQSTTGVAIKAPIKNALWVTVFNTFADRVMTVMLIL